MGSIRLLVTMITLLVLNDCFAQSDSVLQSLQAIPTKYITSVDKKVDKYSTRLTSKTEQTLTKLSRWENKIETLLQKANPEAAQRLFGNNQTTFTTLLQKIKEGKSVAENYRAKYDEYRDKLTTNIKYLQEQKENVKEKLVKSINEANAKLTELDKDVANSEAVEAFIKQRKKQLVDESIKHIGNSKYLTKIDKESYYYIETLRNYKQIFNDKQKAEETALLILNKIPGFKKFAQQNSMLASLFRQPSSSGNGSNVPNLTGLQTRADMQAQMQNVMATGGPNAQAQINQSMQQAQAQLAKLRDKVMQAGGGSSSDLNTPDFKPNEEKTKTFKQRLEFGSNMQFSKNNALVPGTADIGLSLGYKVNSKSVAGIGVSYKLGYGSVQRLSLSHQGISARSYIDWKLKKQFFISGGFEMNHNAAFKNISQLQSYAAWQSSGLIGISKKLKIKTKFFKETKLQLLYDMLANQHTPVSQPVLFRVGYNF